MIFVLAVICSLTALTLLLVRPGMGVLCLLATKPVIDATWKTSFAGINLLRLVGAVVPVVIICRVFASKDKVVKSQFLHWLWLFYLYAGLLSCATLVAAGKYQSSLDLFLRTANGFAGFYMMSLFFADRDAFRKLLVALLLGSLFPVGMGLYQAATGEIWQLRQTVGLIRNVGLYHDAFCLRAFAFQTFTAILLYWEYFSRGKRVGTLALLCLAFLTSIVLFKVYSKAGYFMFGMWVLIWTVFKRKWVMAGAVVVAVFAANFGMQGDLFGDIATVFSKESAAWTGTGDQKYILAGRLTLWDDYWRDYLEASLFSQLFGLGTSAGRAHNDYLRVLVTGGAAGLLAYVALLAGIGWKVVCKLVEDRTPLNVMALMLYCTWLLDTIGLTPSLYPAYQWYIWGFVGLALHGVQDLGECVEAVSANPRRALRRGRNTGFARRPRRSLPARPTWVGGNIR